MTTNLRQIKSFVLRQGKITTGQQNALDNLFPAFGINYQNTPLNFLEIFGNNNPVIIEIGFGMGHATWQIAKNNPKFNYLGIEVHGPGVGSLLMLAKQNEVNNLRVIQYDAILVLKHMIADQSIQGFHIYFPDPWPKKRHHKRRIIQTPFIKLLADKLKQNGYIHLATDWEDYAYWMLDMLNSTIELKNNSADNSFMQRPSYRPLTKFEQRGLNLGHGVWDLVFSKQ